MVCGSPTGVLRYIGVVRGLRKSRRLVGRGVELRQHDRAHYSLYARWYGDEEVWRLTSWMAKPMQRAAVERLFEDRERSALDESFAVHWEGEGEPVGVVSLTNISEANASADLSVIVGNEKDRAKGLGTEAIRLLLDHAFDDVGLNRVGLSVFEFNEAAIHAYEKLGFKSEGKLRQALRRDGDFHDAILMSVLAHEWRGKGS
jgi:RimJ/RimL family protein N-acetyltransferase